MATALRQPLQMSHQHLDFTLSPAVHQLIVGSFGYGHTKVLCHRNTTRWWQNKKFRASETRTKQNYDRDRDHIALVLAPAHDQLGLGFGAWL